MSLQFVLGGPGSGKSWYLEQYIIEESMAHPDREYLLVVPEQNTLQVQQEILKRHPRKTIWNIDVLSFRRLAYRVFEETGADDLEVLTDEGKNFIIRKILSDHADELKVLGQHASRIGYITEIKSVLSELTQYEADEEALEKICGGADISPAFRDKLSDIIKIKSWYDAYMSGRLVPKEALLSRMAALIGDSALFDGAEVFFDGFTGFTPDQSRILSLILPRCRKVTVSVTFAPDLDPARPLPFHHMYAMSRDFIAGLTRLAGEQRAEILPHVVLKENEVIRKPEDLALMGRHLFRKRTPVYEKAPEHIRLYGLKDPAAEAAFIRDRILELTREGLRYGQIAVLSGDPKGYAAYLEDAFAQAGIPYFLDVKKDILSHPFADLIGSLLHLQEAGFSYEAVFRFLKSPYSPLPFETVCELENYVLEQGIRGGAAWGRKWVRLPKGAKEGGEEAQAFLDRINEARETFMTDISSVREVWKRRGKTVRDISEAVLSYLEKREIREILQKQAEDFSEHGDALLADEYGRIYDAVTDLLERFTDLLGDQVLSVNEYIDLWNAGLGESKIGLIPPGQDQVLIGDLERSRPGELSVLFLAGVNEGVTPGNAAPSGLISDHEKEFLKERSVALSPTEREKTGIRKLYLYLALTKPADSVYLTYSRVSSEGNGLRPSGFLKDLIRLFPGLSAADPAAEGASGDAGMNRRWYDESGALAYLAAGFDDLEKSLKDPVWCTLYDYLNEKRPEDVRRMVSAWGIRNPGERLSRETAAALYGRKMYSSVSRLQRFSQCPFMFFMQYGLKLKEREEFEYTAIDEGNLIHKALELLSVRIRQDGASWKDLSDEEIRQRAADAMAQAADGYGGGILNETGREAYMRRRLEKTVEVLAGIFARQLARGSFVPQLFEWHFSGEDVPEFQIQIDENTFLYLFGQLDRMDVAKSGGKAYVRLIDYKTGGKDYSLSEVYAGLDLQLTTYLKAASSLLKKQGTEASPAAIEYCYSEIPSVDDEKVRKEGGSYERALERAMRPSGWYNSGDEALDCFSPDDEELSLMTKVKRNQDGTPSKNSPVLTDDEWEILEEFSLAKAKEIGSRIASGDISIEPAGSSDRGPCGFCPYEGICRFSTHVPGFERKTVPKMDAEEAIEKMEVFLCRK